jgi:hypothetical protein
MMIVAVSPLGFERRAAVAGFGIKEWMLAMLASPRMLPEH